MLPGSLTFHIDAVQLLVAAFALFFAGLVYHLRQQDKREGYPLEDPAPTGQRMEGFPPLPAPKKMTTFDKGEAQMPHETSPPELKARPLFDFPGAPMVPTGNPLLDGVGPAGYAMRKEQPLIAKEGKVQVVPLREASEWRVVEGDADPRGMRVIGVDGGAVGIVVDLWVDRSVKILRYLEVALGGTDDHVLLPIYFADVRRSWRTVRATTIAAALFADVPRLATAHRVTAREEDRINAYFAGGLLYGRHDAGSPRRHSGEFGGAR